MIQKWKKTHSRQWKTPSSSGPQKGKDTTICREGYARCILGQLGNYNDRLSTNRQINHWTAFLWPSFQVERFAEMMRKAHQGRFPPARHCTITQVGLSSWYRSILWLWNSPAYNLFPWSRPVWLFSIRPTEKAFQGQTFWLAKWSDTLSWRLVSREK